MNVIPVWNVRRFVYALCLAAVAVGMLAARVEPRVERIRHRVVTTPVPASGTTLIVQLPELPRLAGTHAAIVARLRGSSAAARIVLSLDGTPVAETTIPAARERRIDWSFVAPAGQGHHLAFTGDLAGWTLSYLEIANIHGFSRGFIDFAIVPASRRHPPVAPGWLLILAGLGALALAPRRDWPAPGPIRILHRVASAVVLAVFATAVATEWVSRFAIVMSLHTFLLGAAVLYAEPLSRVWHWSRRIERVRQASRLLPHLALMALFVWCIAGFYHPVKGFTGFLQFGQEFESRALPVLSGVPHATEPGWGYDGQFYAQLALDPLLQSEALRVALDSPEYRGRRILFPAMAWVLGLGRPGPVLQAFSLLNVASWIVLACLLLRWLPAGSGRTLAAWAACLFSPGLLASVRSALPDGPGLLLLVVGLIAVERHRPRLAALLLGVSGLGRETNLLGGTMLLPARWHREDLARLAGRAAVMLLPLGLWVVYLKTLGMPPDVAGARNFDWPAVAYVGKWRSTIGALGMGADHYIWFSLLSGAALAIQAVVLAAQRNWSSPWWRLGSTYALFGLVLGSAVWEGHPGAAPRVLLPMTIAFNVLLPGSRLFWPLWILGNLPLLHGLEVIGMPGLWF
jgi:hypothetical protein